MYKRMLEEFLKYGKKIYLLEFSPSVNEIISPLYNFYSNKIIPFLGEKVADNKAAYTYLTESIEDFPHNQELENIFTRNGFFFAIIEKNIWEDSLLKCF